jgi:hypothetical protein
MENVRYELDVLEKKLNLIQEEKEFNTEITEKYLDLKKVYPKCDVESELARFKQEFIALHIKERMLNRTIYILKKDLQNV